MISNFGVWLRRFIVRWSLYALGIFVVLAIIGTGAFVLARPKIDNLVLSQTKKYGVEFDSWDVGFSGKANLYNVRIPLANGTIIRIGQLSGRPPVAGFSGSVSMYNLNAQKSEMTLQVPELHINGIVKKDKDPSIKSHMLQKLMEINIASVDAPKIEFINRMNGKTEKSALNGFYLSKLETGKIGRITFNNMDTGLSGIADGKSVKILDGNIAGARLQSGAIEISDIDLASAYSYFTGRLVAGNDGKTIVGPLNVSDVKIDVGSDKRENAHFALGTMRSTGLALRPAKVEPAQTIKAFMTVNHEGVAPEVKKKALGDLLLLVESLASVDAEVKNVNIQIPDLKTGFASFELKPINWNHMVPEGLHVKLQDFKIDTTSFEGKKADMLHKLGFNTLEFSAVFDTLWDPKTNILSLNEASFIGKNIGEVILKGSLINVRSDLFSGDLSRMAGATGLMALSDMDVTMTDFGTIKRLVDFLVAEVGDSDSEAVRRDLLKVFDNFAIESPKMISDDPQKRQVMAEALQKFFSDSGTLNIHMKSKAKRGISMTELIAAGTGELRLLLDMMDLTFTNVTVPKGGRG